MKFCGMLIGLTLMQMTACSSGPKLPPVATDGVILAFGDSLTYGTGAGEGESYPAVLARLTGRSVVNSGVPGEITSEGLSRLASVLDHSKPVLMILCHGGNDLIRRQDQRQAADNLRSMIKMARGRGVSVLLVAVPVLGISLSPAPFYGEVAKEFGIPCEDSALGRIMAKSALKSDYIHPNAAGYRQLAEALAEKLKKSGAI